MYTHLLSHTHNFTGGSGSGTGTGSGSGSGNAYSMTPSSMPQDGGESGSNGVNERSVDIGDDETTAITFKGS